MCFVGCATVSTSIPTVNQVQLPPIIVNFLQQQASSLPQYHKPVPFKSNSPWPKLDWLIWGAIAIVIFQVTIIISFGDSFNNWYVVGLSLLMIGLGGTGGWWWFVNEVRSQKSFVQKLFLQRGFMPRSKNFSL